MNDEGVLYLERIAWALEGIELQLEYRRLRRGGQMDDLQVLIHQLDARRLAYVKRGWMTQPE